MRILLIKHNGDDIPVSWSNVESTCFWFVYCWPKPKRKAWTCLSRPMSLSWIDCSLNIIINFRTFDTSVSSVQIRNKIFSARLNSKYLIVRDRHGTLPSTGTACLELQLNVHWASGVIVNRDTASNLHPTVASRSDEDELVLRTGHVESLPLTELFVEI